MGFVPPRRESWLPGSLPPPFYQCKLPHSPDKRRNSFWFQKGLAEATVLLRLRRSRNPVSEAPQSHSDRTSPKSVRSEIIVEGQKLKTSAGPYRFALVISPSVGLESAVRVLQRSSAGCKNAQKCCQCGHRVSAVSARLLPVPFADDGLAPAFDRRAGGAVDHAAIVGGIFLANWLLAEHAAGLALLQCKCQPLFTDSKPRPKLQSVALGPFQFIQGVIT